MKAKNFDEKFDANNEDLTDDLDLDSIKRPYSMKKIPDFKTEQDEREFWETHDSTDYVDWSKAQLAVFPNLKKTTKLF